MAALDAGKCTDVHDESTFQLVFVWTHVAITLISLQWGHTVSDFQKPLQRMQQPWRTLRSLGLYKPNGILWGWDYISAATGRIVKEEMGFTAEALSNYLNDKEGPRLLPEWLEGSFDKVKEDSEVWMDFYSDTLNRLESFITGVYVRFAILYLSVFGALPLFLFVTGMRRFAANGTGKTLRRFIATHAIVAIAAWILFEWTSKSNWARNIQRDRAFRVPAQKSVLGTNGPATLPRPSDILVPDDYQSAYIGSYADMFRHSHPGNIQWAESIHLSRLGYDSLTLDLQGKLRQNLLAWASQDGSRILQKNIDNDWTALNDKDSDHFAHKELVKANRQLGGLIVRQIENLLSEAQFGYLRETSMHSTHTPVLLRSLQKQILDYKPIGNQDEITRKGVSAFLQLQSLVGIDATKSLDIKRPSRLSGVPSQVDLGDNRSDNWVSKGDVIEALDDGCKSVSDK